MFSFSEMPSTTAVLSTYTTFAASAVLVRTVVNEVQSVGNQIIPKVIQEKIMSKLGILVGNLSSDMCLYINQTNGLSNNEVFEAAEIYLRTRINPSFNQLIVSKEPREAQLSITINKGQEVIDTFNGLILKWKSVCTETQKTSSDEGYFQCENVERKSYELSFDKKYRDVVLNSYLPFILERSKAIKEEKRGVKLYALGNQYGGEYDGGPWGSVNLDHPSTFETLAMDPAVKQELIEDLTRFVRRRSFYKRVGKAWKRGYLLYGPPGTGKSSLVAAMANFLKFDIYDLELASLRGNSELRKLIVSTKNRSIVVIEDIDCSIDLENREDGDHSPIAKAKQLTLSGLLNFIDGLWSSCGDERIIIFTTNHKDRLDPALIRPGRMDMHIHMSYCTFSGFKILASNYLGIKSHPKFSEIEKLIGNVEVTPAEIAEELMKSEKVDIAIEKVVEFLCKKRDECVGKDEGLKGGDEKQEENKEECENKLIGKKRKAKGGRRRQ